MTEDQIAQAVNIALIVLLVWNGLLALYGYFDE